MSEGVKNQERGIGLCLCLKAMVSSDCMLTVLIEGEMLPGRADKPCLTSVINYLQIENILS